MYTICTRYRLSNHDIEDVGQNVWLLLVEQLGRLLLVEQLGRLREPAALPGWLATTTIRECLRVMRRSSVFIALCGDETKINIRGGEAGA